MALLDLAVLEKFRATVGDELYTQLVDEFLVDCERLERKIRGALKDDDPDAVRRYAHELRGVAVLFGAKELAELCVAADRHSDLKKASEAVAMCAAVRKEIKSPTRVRRTHVT